MFKLLPLKPVFLISLLIGLLTFLNVKSYFHSGLPYTHDGENHLARFANYKIALKEGQYPPRFAPNLLNHYGYPVFNYNYPLANILSVPFSVVGVSYTLTFKVLMTGFLLSGLVGVWVWLHSFQVSTRATLVGLMAFGLSPYIFNTLNYRGNIGELMALGVLPWLLVVVEQLRKTKRYTFRLIVIGGLVSTAFLLAHNVTVIFGLPLVLGYAGWRLGKSRQAWFQFGLTWLIALGLSLWFWLPAIAEKNQIILDQAGLSNEYSRHFPTWLQLIAAPLGFGFSFPGTVDSLAFNLGLTQVVLVILGGLWTVRNWKQVKTQPAIALFTVAALVLVVAQLQFSQPVWQVVPLVRFIQFPWRLSIFLPVLAAGLGAWLVDDVSRLGNRLLIGLVLVQALALTRVPEIAFIHHQDIEYDLFGQSTTTANENLPKTFHYLNYGDWQPAPSIIQGVAAVKVDSWTGTRRQYTLQIESPEAVIAEPTMKFLGWQTHVASSLNSTPESLEYYDDETIAGRIAYRLPQGEYQVLTSFTKPTWARQWGNGVSLITSLGLSLVTFYLLSKKAYGHLKHV
jgi:hypothetical protein